LQREHAKLGQYFLLPDALLQRLQRQIRRIALRARLDDGLFASFGWAHLLDVTDKAHGSNVRFSTISISAWLRDIVLDPEQRSAI
jgi:hypothetical protein